MYEEFTDEELLTAMEEMSVMTLIKLLVTSEDEKERMQMLVDRVLRKKPEVLLQRYETLVSMDEKQLRALVEEYEVPTSEIDMIVVKDLLENYMPKNAEIMTLIADNPSMIDTYRYFYDEQGSQFPFIIDLFQNDIVSLPIIEQYLFKVKDKYKYEDLIISLQRHLTYDSYLPDFYRLIMRVYGKMNLPLSLIDDLLSKDDLNSTLRLWLNDIRPYSLSYAKKPDHIEYHPEIDSDNLPSLKLLPVTEEKIMSILPQEQKEYVDKVDPWTRRYILASARLNGDEIINSPILDLWFGMINPGRNFRFPMLEDVGSIRKYGGSRMLLDVENEVSEDNLLFGEDSTQEEWFTGSCLQSDIQIAHPHYAVRRPLASGGWVGCYSEWSYVLDHINDLIDDYLEVNGLADDMKREELNILGEEHSYLKDRLTELDLTEFFHTNMRIADRDEEGRSAVSYSTTDNEQFEKRLSELNISKTLLQPTVRRVGEDGTKTTVTFYSGKWEEPSLNPITEHTVTINGK